MKWKRSLTSLKVKKGQQLNHREIQMINDRSIDGLLLIHVQNKGNGYVLHFTVDGLIPLSDFLKVNPMNKRLFVVLLRNVIFALNGIRENHFSKNLIEFSLESSYVDPATWHVYLMYVPLQPYEANGSLKDFILDLSSNCTFEADEDTSYVRTLMEEVNAAISYSSSMLENYCDLISGELVAAKTDQSKKIRCTSCGMFLNEQEFVCPFCGKMAKKVSSNRIDLSPVKATEGVSIRSKQSETISVGDNRADCSRSSISINEDENGVITVFRKSPNSSHKVWLEDKNYAKKILLTKFPFRLGKMEGVTDYRICSNTVSRKHADILKEQGKYYIIDLGSTNGTYINGKRIQPGVKEELSDGAHLKLADVEFKFHID